MHYFAPRCHHYVSSSSRSLTDSACTTSSGYISCPNPHSSPKSNGCNDGEECDCSDGACEPAAAGTLFGVCSGREWLTVRCCPLPVTTLGSGQRLESQLEPHWSVFAFGPRDAAGRTADDSFGGRGHPVGHELSEDRSSSLASGACCSPMERHPQAVSVVAEGNAACGMAVGAVVTESVFCVCCSRAFRNPMPTAEVVQPAARGCVAVLWRRGTS